MVIMEMMRKVPDKSHNYGIEYPMVEETCDSYPDIDFIICNTFSSNGNFIRRVITKEVKNSD